jgi:hypothetical protein
MTCAADVAAAADAAAALCRLLLRLPQPLPRRRLCHHCSCSKTLTLTCQASSLRRARRFCPSARAITTSLTHCAVPSIAA